MLLSELKLLSFYTHIYIIINFVPLLGYTGVIVAEPIVWFIMVIPLLVKIYNMPVLRKQGHGI